MSDINTTHYDKSSFKGTKVFIFDKAKNVITFSRCKVVVNPPTLSVILNDGAPSSYTCTFNRKFFLKGLPRKVFFIPDFNIGKDFIIMFSKQSNCDIVYGYFKKHRVNAKISKIDKNLEEEVFRTSFFIPAIKAIQEKIDGHTELKAVMHKLIRSSANEMKSFYWELFAKTFLSSTETADKISNLQYNDDVIIKKETITKKEITESVIEILSDDEDDGDTHRVDASPLLSCLEADDDNVEESRSEIHVGGANLRERSKDVCYTEQSEDENFHHSEDENFSDENMNKEYGDESDDDEMPPAKKRRLNSGKEKINRLYHGNSSTSSLEYSPYLFFEYTENRKIKKKLVIFSSQDRKKCFEYSLYRGHGHYQCRKCDPKIHYVYVKVAVDDTGKNELIFGNNEHICEPINFVPENYTSTKIVKLPDYKLIGKPSSLKRANERLIIFSDSEKKLCYEYSLKERGYQCLSCILLHKHVSAKLVKDSENGDYLELNRANHICQPKEYIPPDAPLKTVYKPYFKILTMHSGNGNERKSLRIFDSNDKKTFYRYHYSKAYGSFMCSGCTKKKPHRQVTAKLCVDENNVSYLELSKIKHICT